MRIKNKYISVSQEAGHINNTVVLIFRHIQCLHLMNSEIAWVLVFSGTQSQPQIILDPDNLLDYLSVFYDYRYLYYFSGTAAHPYCLKLIKHTVLLSFMNHDAN